MKSISRIMRKLLAFGLLPAAAVVLTGCDGFIFEDEGDCDPYYKVRFRYDRNLKFADAFAAEVDEISYDQIPMLDRDSAERLGDRKLGELSDMVSQGRLRPTARAGM